MPETTTLVGLSGFSDMLRSALGPLVDPAGSFVDLMAPDGVMEFPYAPPGSVTRLEGREALAAHLSSLGNIIEIDGMTEPTVHRTADPDVVVLEFGCVGRGLRTGRPYNQRYVSVITLRRGKIVRYVDYWNPLVVLEAVGGAEALADALGGAR